MGFLTHFEEEIVEVGNAARLCDEAGDDGVEGFDFDGCNPVGAIGENLILGFQESVGESFELRYRGGYGGTDPPPAGTSRRTCG